MPINHLQLSASLPACVSGDRQACACGACLGLALPLLVGLSETCINLLHPLAFNSPQILQLSVAWKSTCYLVYLILLPHHFPGLSLDFMKWDMAQQCSLSACSPPSWSFSPLFHLPFTVLFLFNFFFLHWKRLALFADFLCRLPCFWKFLFFFSKHLKISPSLQDLPLWVSSGHLFGSWGCNSLYVYNCLQVFCPSPVDPGSTSM